MRVSQFEEIQTPHGWRNQLSKGLSAKVLWFKNVTNECVANVLALNVYPLGIVEKKFQAYPHPQFSENQYPILFVHGVLHNHSAFIRLEKKLRRLGWHNIFSLNYKTSTGSIHRMTGDLQKKVEEILKATGAEQIDVIAHSLGGLVSRNYMSNGTGRGKIRKLITLGTPHNGTERSRFLKLIPGSSLGEDLMKGSYFISNLNSTPIPKGSEIISISSDFDWTSGKPESFKAAGLPETAFKNINYQGIGHTGMLYNEAIFNDILHTISEDS